jgi:type I restriction enzyme, R subunit
VQFLWDLEKGNPKIIFKFPSPSEIGAIKYWKPDRESLAKEEIKDNFITAHPNAQQITFKKRT